MFTTLNNTTQPQPLPWAHHEGFAAIAAFTAWIEATGNAALPAPYTASGRRVYEPMTPAQAADRLEKMAKELRKQSKAKGA